MTTSCSAFPHPLLLSLQPLSPIFSRIHPHPSTSAQNLNLKMNSWGSFLMRGHCYDCNTYAMSHFPDPSVICVTPPRGPWAPRRHTHRESDLQYSASPLLRYSGTLLLRNVMRHNVVTPCTTSGHIPNSPHSVTPCHVTRSHARARA